MESRYRESSPVAADASFHPQLILGSRVALLLCTDAEQSLRVANPASVVAILDVGQCGRRRPAREQGRRRERAVVIHSYTKSLETCKHHRSVYCLQRRRRQAAAASATAANVSGRRRFGSADCRLSLYIAHAVGSSVRRIPTNRLPIYQPRPRTSRVEKPDRYVIDPPRAPPSVYSAH